LSGVLTSGAIKARARELGFDLCGVAPAHDFPELKFLPEWLARGYAGDMDYLSKSAERRADIRNFLPSAKSVIVTGTIYNTERRGRIRDRHADTIEVARYARGQDYHVVLADRLKSLLEWMRNAHAGAFDAETFVDKHHVQERVYGQYAGLGWIGKNTLLINREQGSYFFIAGIATSLELEADGPGFDQCGACTLCIDACPTAAIVDAGVVDATKCISYLTIEVEDEIPRDQRPLIGNHAYGCDVCQDVCPWNLAAPTTIDPAWQAPQRDGLSAAELWQRSDQELHTLIKGSAMTYLPLSRLRRNLATVIANTGDPALAEVLDRPGNGVRNAARSTLSPVVQDAVSWAKERLKEESPTARSER
jgi:epoxyqueuosine reductase